MKQPTAFLASMLQIDCVVRQIPCWFRFAVVLGFYISGTTSGKVVHLSVVVHQYTARAAHGRSQLLSLLHKTDGRCPPALSMAPRLEK